MKNSRMLTSNITIFMDIAAQKYPNKAILVPNQKFFFVLYETRFLQIHPRDTHIRQFSSRA